MFGPGTMRAFWLWSAWPSGGVRDGVSRVVSRRALRQGGRVVGGAYCVNRRLT